MQAGDDILRLLAEKGAEAARRSESALILQPGAIGDCLLTLPLANFLKQHLPLGGVEMLGRADYLSILPGRTNIDGIHSIDSIQLHRLFVNHRSFDLPDHDPLIDFFAGYTWIISFLGEPESNFEQNLIFTAHCTHSAEVITLPTIPGTQPACHISHYYIRRFIESCNLDIDCRAADLNAQLLRPSTADVQRGTTLLEELGCDTTARVVVIHPGSGAPRKCWHLSNFIAVAESLRRKDFEVLFLLGPAETERLTHPDRESMLRVGRCANTLPLGAVVALLSCAHAYIGNDSGITHLAAGLGLRTMAVFGPTNPTVYRPIGPRVQVFSWPGDHFDKDPAPALQRQLLDALAC